MALATAEIRRAKLRFGLLAGAIGLLVFLLLFLNTLSQTLLTFFVGGIKNNSAQVLVYGESARRNLQASRLLPSTLNAVKGVPGVADAAPVGQATVSADAGKGLTDISLWGFEGGHPGQPQKVVEGHMPAAGEAVVDKADTQNGFTIGNEVVVKPTGYRLRIVGYTADSKFAVLPTVYINLTDYEAILRGLNPGAPFIPANFIAVEPMPDTKPSELASRITTSVPDVEALDRATAASSVPGVESISQSFTLIVGITFVIVVVVIGFFFLIITVQKLRILMALRAVGGSVGFIARSLVTQILIVVGIGLALAVALLTLATATSSDSFPLAVDPYLVAEAALAVLVFSLAAGLVSIRRIAKLDPAEAARVG